MILILGVTASGKGKLAFALAKSLGAEIISIDSMKVYRRMDIGTAKPPKENRDQIPLSPHRRRRTQRLIQRRPIPRTGTGRYR